MSNRSQRKSQHHKKSNKKVKLGFISSLVIFFLMLIGNQLKQDSKNTPITEQQTRHQPQKNSQKNSQAAALKKIRAARSDKNASFWITVQAEVIKKLPDDNEGSRHQRFLIKLDRDITLLVAHNIDLAQKVPIKVGDQIQLHGKYEWNARGGVLHWTHHNPHGGQGGWIKHANRNYE